MGLFKNVKTFLKGKSNEAADVIEDKNRIMFAKESLNDMQDQLRNAQQNLGKIKAQLMGIERDVNKKNEEHDLWIEKARVLKVQEKMDLAMQCAQKAVDIKSEIESLESQKKMIVGHVTQQEANVTKLRTSIDSAKRQFQSMKAMDQVSKSTESLLDINVTGVDNALSKFEEYNRRTQADLDEKSALLEAQSAGDLTNEVDEALNLKGAKANSLLDSL